MQTSFNLAQLSDPHIQESEKILRTCVHCGFCTATCPTYILLGDELDSPRGRIYLIKEMLEQGGPPSESTVTHIDRCLSCLSCMTTCPSGVHYMHLVDHARNHIEKFFKRPWFDKMLRRVLILLLQHPTLMRPALGFIQFFRFAKPLLPKKLQPVFALTPQNLARPLPLHPQIFSAIGTRRKRVALLTGCVQTVLVPEINAATIRLLQRHGCEVVVTRAGCCGSVAHHLGDAETSRNSAGQVITAFDAEISGAGLDAIISNTSGCGTTLKDYGFMFRHDPQLAEAAKRVSTLTKDITEIISDLGLKTPVQKSPLTIAYHSACSMQHGQKLNEIPRQLLVAAGFSLREIPESHLCCGSAGTYNILQSEIADQLRDRKLINIKSVAPDIVATGNIGCMMQLATGVMTPIVHTACLLDWATGGPKPPSII